jgi:hypothetical protein
MAKVLVERSRVGDVGNYGQKRAKRKDYSDEAPLREGMRRPHILNHGGKALNENLSPLKKFLRSQVGRPWDKVYSDLNKHVKVSNAVQAHVRQHLDGMVERRVVYDELGRPCSVRRGIFLLHKGDLYVNAAGILTLCTGFSKVRVVRAKGVKSYTVYRRETRDRSTDYWGRRVVACELFVGETARVQAMGLAREDIITKFDSGTHLEALQRMEGYSAYREKFLGYADAPR